MTYRIKPTSLFKKDLKKAQKRGYNMELLAEVIRLLASGETLPKIKITHCRANTAVAESVTFCRIGC